MNSGQARRPSSSAGAVHVAELRTPRLCLRRARRADATALHAVFTDPEAMRYWSTAPHQAFSQTEAWVDDMIAAPPELSDDFLVEEAGVVIGKAGFWRLPELGFILRRDRWRQGLMLEALTAVIAHGFHARGLAEITADVDPRNAACLGLLHRLGFEKRSEASRTFCIDGVWSDSVYLSLPRPAGR